MQSSCITRSSEQCILSLHQLAGPGKSKNCLFGGIERDNRWKKSKEEVGFQEVGILAVSVRRIVLNNIMVKFTTITQESFRSYSSSVFCFNFLTSD